MFDSLPELQSVPGKESMGHSSLEDLHGAVEGVQAQVEQLLLQPNHLSTQGLQGGG